MEQCRTLLKQAKVELYVVADNENIGLRIRGLDRLDVLNFK
jgi:hypothetical protein